MSVFVVVLVVASLSLWLWLCLWLRACHGAFVIAALFWFVVVCLRWRLRLGACGCVCGRVCGCVFAIVCL